MKSSRILISLLMGAILCSSVFAQETAQSQAPQTKKRSEIKAKRDKRMRDGRASSLRSMRKRAKHGKAAKLEKQMKQDKKKAEGKKQ